MFRLRVAVLAVLALNGGGVVAHANSFDYLLWEKSPKWDGGLMTWRYNPANQPATVTTEAMLALIQAGMDKWSSACAIRFEYQGTTSVTPTLNDGVNVIGWTSADGYDGYTQYWSSGAYFSDVDIRLDPARLTQTNQIEGIVSHELGHAIGLDHSDAVAAIMFAKPYHSYDYQRTLREDDISGCKALYGGVASGTPHAFDAVASGTLNALTLGARITIASVDRNTEGSIYVAAHLGNVWYFHDGSRWGYWSGDPIPVYFTGPLTDRIIPLADAIDATPLASGEVIVGYGRNVAEMLASRRYQTIYLVSR